MLVLRLQRTGRSRVPTYRVVLVEKSWAAKGRFQEILGHYLLDRDPPVFQVHEERIRYWMEHGAILSDTLARVLLKSGMTEAGKFIRRYVKKKPKSASEESASALQPVGSDSVTGKE
ncbi:30S ribosomal protein S16 [Candidatus Peregrinibacteria bacterium]|nr:30S ribosomal protein S16 [Candidatus Peregrinibacteria bacterium]